MNSTMNVNSEAMEYKETKRPTPNLHDGRNEQKYLILHHTGSDYDSAVNWLTNPDASASAHVVIAKNGRRTILAAPEKITWHAGVSEYEGHHNINPISIGVEFEGDTNKEPLTVEQLRSFLEYYSRRLSKSFHLRNDLSNLTDHRTIAPERKVDIHPEELARVKAALRTYLEWIE